MYLWWNVSSGFLENLNVDGWMEQHHFTDVPSVALLVFYLIYILLYSKASNWPPKLIMQLIPQNLLVSLQVWTLGKVQWAAVPSPLHPPSPPPMVPSLDQRSPLPPAGARLGPTTSRPCCYVGKPIEASFCGYYRPVFLFSPSPHSDLYYKTPEQWHSILLLMIPRLWELCTESWRPVELNL